MMRLTDSLIEILAYTAFVIRADKSVQPSYSEVRGEMRQLISRSERLQVQCQFPQEDYLPARFAAFAWVDETILSSDWEGRHQWQREPLQREYYNTTDAGELFYERLNFLGPHQRDVREVYYLCLALGFTGQYIHEGDDFLLEQLRISNLKLLTGSSTGVLSLDGTNLFPEAYPADDEHDAPRRPRKSRLSGFTIACVTAPVALFGLLYAIYFFILDNIGDNLIGTVL